MTWKDLPYWLKFAILFTIIFSFLFLLAGLRFTTCPTGRECPKSILYNIMSITVLPIKPLVYNI